MGERKSYTEEFKRDAVELSLNSDKFVKEISEDLGINILDQGYQVWK